MTKFDKVIPPGSEGKIYASIDLAHASGVIEKHIDLSTSDPEMAHASLSIKAMVKSLVEITPVDQLQFSVLKGESQTIELSLVPKYTKPVTLGNATTGSKYLDLSMTPPAAGAKDAPYKLKVTLKDTADIGNFNDVIHVAAEGLPENQVNIPVMATVRGPINVNPPQVAFVFQNYPEQVAPVGTVNLRAEGKADGAVMKQVKPGSIMHVITQNDEWYQVIAQDPQRPVNTGPNIGWVKKSAVRVTKNGDAPLVQTVNLQKMNGQNFKLLDTINSMSQIKVELDPNSDQGKNYNLKLSIVNLDRSHKRNIQGEVIVKTDDPVQPEVKIPVYIIIS